MTLPGESPLTGGARLLRRRFVQSLSLALANTGARAADDVVQIYAAMTFRPALDQVLMAYRDSGGAALAVYAPTPVLVRQVAGGAPADILLTADPDWMDQAARQSLIQPATRANLMANDLVLAGPAGSMAVGVITETFALAAFLNGGRLAMCDPEHDPAGRYAKQSLQKLGFWQAIEPQIAIAASAPAAVVLVDHGEARAAVCFRTDLHGDVHSMIVGTFPSASHAPIVYPAALTSGTHNARAAAALAFLRSPKAAEIFASFGYQPSG